MVSLDVIMGSWIVQHIWNFLFGIIIVLIGYFLPIKNVVHVMSAAIMFDLFTGLWAARVKGKGWKSIKMWRTIYKLFISTIIIMLLYAMDKEMGTPIIQMHKIAAWLITGFEIWSILENAAEISNLRIFIILRNFMQDKIEQQTGINIEDGKEKNITSGTKNN